jgi:hypothetical protein
MLPSESPPHGSLFTPAENSACESSLKAQLSVSLRTNIIDTHVENTCESTLCSNVSPALLLLKYLLSKSLSLSLSPSLSLRRQWRPQPCRQSDDIAACLLLLWGTMREDCKCTSREVLLSIFHGSQMEAFYRNHIHLCREFSMCNVALPDGERAS